MDQEEAEGILKRVSSPEFKVNEEFHMANSLSTEDPRSIKLLGSKSVNSLKLTEISRKLEIKLGKGMQEGMFYTPSQVTIPMTVPLYIIQQDQVLSKAYKDKVRELDLCGMWRVPLEQEKVLADLRDIYKEKD